jgi:prolyl-tRNA editing enzyme YbaK/EbsC (Cys-tRNA(Pro) deacylase)
LSELSRSAARVREALLQRGEPADVRELPDSTRTAPEAAAAVGCRVEQIVKSLVFRRARSETPVLVLAGGANRVDEDRVAALLGEPVAKADADYVRAHTGYAIGGVPPLGHPEPLETLIDEDLVALEEVWAAAGTPRAVFPIPGARLPELTGGRVAAVARR